MQIQKAYLQVSRYCLLALHGSISVMTRSLLGFVYVLFTLYGAWYLCIVSRSKRCFNVVTTPLDAVFSILTRLITSIYMPLNKPLIESGDLIISTDKKHMYRTLIIMALGISV